MTNTELMTADEARKMTLKAKEQELLYRTEIPRLIENAINNKQHGIKVNIDFLSTHEQFILFDLLDNKGYSLDSIQDNEDRAIALTITW